MTLGASCGASMSAMRTFLPFTAFALGRNILSVGAGTRLSPQLAQMTWLRTQLPRTKLPFEKELLT